MGGLTRGARDGRRLLPGHKAAGSRGVVFPSVESLPERFNAATFFIDRHVAEGRAGRTAFRFAGRTITYGDVADLAARAAGALAEAGLEAEQRALLLLDDSPAFAAAFWGAARLGAVAVPVNTLMSAAEYEFLLNDSRARVAVIEAEAAARVLAGRARCPWLRAVLVAGGGAAIAGGVVMYVLGARANRVALEPRVSARGAALVLKVAY